MWWEKIKKYIYRFQGKVSENPPEKDTKCRNQKRKIKALKVMDKKRPIAHINYWKFQIFFLN